MSGVNFGAFVPTTNIWDVSEIYQAEKLSPELKELLVRMYQNLNLMSLNLNIKDTGMYATSEFVNSQSFFPNPALQTGSSVDPVSRTQRQVYRCVINFGALPNTATKSVPHNLTFNAGFTMTRLYGTASKADASQFIPVPYSAANAAVNNVELWVDGTNVNIKTTADYSLYTTTYVILEYLKS